MYDQLVRAIKWNTAGIVLYKILLFIHQSFLFTCVPQTEYGIIGTLFSTIYFLIPVSNFGFDYTILSFFKKSRSTKESSFVLRQYFYRVGILLGIIGIATICYFNLEALKFISPAMFTTCVTLFFFESLKHSLRTHAHIFHINKKIAIFENGSLVAYIATIWGYFWIYQTIPTLLLFLPLTITSGVETIIIAFAMINSYSKLNKTSCETQTDTKFARESFFNYINQLAKAFFSPNFLIIFLAATIGFHKTGYIKFMTNIIIFLYTIFYRSIRMSGGAFLSSISTMPQSLIKKTFNTITNYYLQTLAIVSIYFVGLLYFYSSTQGLPNSSDCLSTYTIILLFCLVSFMEYGSLTYETLFITQKQGKILAAVNSINILGALLFLLLSYLQPHPMLLFFLCLLKLGTTGYIMHQAYQIWDVAISLQVDATTILIHLSISLSLVSYFL